MTDEQKIEQLKLEVLDAKRAAGNAKVKLLNALADCNRLREEVAARDRKIEALKVNHIDDDGLKDLLSELARHQREGVELREQVEHYAAYIDRPSMGAPGDW